MELPSPEGPLAPAARPAAAAIRSRAAALGLVGLGAAAFFLVVAPKSYSVGEWLLWRYLLVWLYAALFSVACASLGHLLLRRVFRADDRPLVETLVFSVALGLAGYALVFHLVGAVRLLNAGFALGFPVVAIALGGRGLFGRLRTSWANRAPAPPAGPVAIAGWILGIAATGFVYLGVLTPDAIGFDAAWQHLVIAQDYAREGRIVPFVADYAKNHPQLAGLIHTYAYLVPGLDLPERWVLALHGEFVLFLWTLAGVGAAVRALVGKKVSAAWAGFFLFPAIFVYDCNLQASADHVLAFFAIPSFLAALRAGRTLAPRDLALAGSLIGASLLVKYQALFLGCAAAVPLAAGWLPRLHQRLRGREEALPWKAILAAPLWAAGAALVVAAPHFLRNAIFHGNPMYPYLQDVFASTPTTPDAAFLVGKAFADYNFRPRGPFFSRLLDTVGVWTTFSWKTHYSFSKDVPVFGSLFTLCLPLALLLPRPRKHVWLALGAGAAGVLAWAATYRLDRNLQAMTPLLAAGTVAVLVRAWEAGALARVGVVPLVLAQLFWSADTVAMTQLRQLTRSLEVIRSGYEGQRAPGVWDRFRAEFVEVNAHLPPDARVLLHASHMSLGIDREVLTDFTGQQGLFYPAGYRTAAELWESYRRAGVSHLVSTPGDRPAAARAEDVLFALVVDHAGPGKRLGRFLVTPLPATPPPDRGALLVAAVGLPHYADGLYPVEALHVNELVPRRFLRFPAPAEPLPADPEGRQALFARAGAVFVGKGAATPDDAKALAASFRKASSFRHGLELHLPKRDLRDRARALGATRPFSSRATTSKAAP